MRLVALSDLEIKKCIANGDIVISPYDEESLGTNSYDVHLSPHLAMYRDRVLDSKVNNPLVHWEIPETGFTLMPGNFYLGTIIEYTEAHKHIPQIDGKSSSGRLSINIHATAGRGDVGFTGVWTLEIFVFVPVTVYPGMPIGQVYWDEVTGEVDRPYNSRSTSKYNNKSNIPMGSMMWKNFDHKTGKWA